MFIIKAVFEGRVIYEPLTHTIYEINDQKYQSNLAVPASLCLLSLLEHKNEVVSHSTLLSQVWESRGMRVSTNTVYQNISLLRKSLADLGLKGEIIKTIPKRGFVIPECVMIEIHYDESLKDSNLEPYKGEDKNESGKKFICKNRHVLNFSLVILFLICSYVTFTALILNPKLPSYSFKDYQEIKKLGDCHVFRNSSLREDEFFYKIIASYNLECSRDNWWYFTNLSPNPEVSIIRCTNKLENKNFGQENFCYSDFYMDGVE